jgi:hypothetical protein
MMPIVSGYATPIIDVLCAGVGWKSPAVVVSNTKTSKEEVRMGTSNWLYLLVDGR